MPVQIVAVAAWAASIGGSVASGYLIDRYLGDGNYTRSEFATDVVLGMAGVGVAKSGAKAGYAIHLTRQASRAKKADRIREAERAADAARTVGYHAGKEMAEIIVIETAVPHLIPNKKTAVGVTAGVAVEIFRPIATVQSIKKARAAAKKGSSSSRKRCNRFYRGKQCIRNWPHGGKHIYV
jgi:hypothetical protein